MPKVPIAGFGAAAAGGGATAVSLPHATRSAAVDAASNNGCLIRSPPVTGEYRRPSIAPKPLGGRGGSESVQLAPADPVRLADVRLAARQDSFNDLVEHDRAWLVDLEVNGGFDVDPDQRNARIVRRSGFLRVAAEPRFPIWAIQFCDLRSIVRDARRAADRYVLSRFLVVVREIDLRVLLELVQLV